MYIHPALSYNGTRRCCKGEDWIDKKIKIFKLKNKNKDKNKKLINRKMKVLGKLIKIDKIFKEDFYMTP